MFDCQHHARSDRAATQRSTAMLLALSSVLLVFALGLPASAFASASVGRTPQGTGTGEDLSGVAFANASDGWVVSDSGTILATTDGGTTWNKQKSGTSDYLGAVAFANASDGWAVGGGNDGLALATTDGGATWNKQASSTVASFFGVTCSDATHAWAVGWGNVGLILATTDGGATWNYQDVTVAAFLGVTSTDAAHAWAVGISSDNSAPAAPWHDTILATTDGGVTWTPQDPHTSQFLTGIAFANVTDGWAVGDDGTIRATTDGGTTWKAQKSGTAQHLSAVAFADATDGWAVGLHGTILATANAGATWKTQNSRTARNLTAVAFPNATDGWAVGDNGLILATTDGGATWHSQGALFPRLMLKVNGLTGGVLKLGKRLTLEGTERPINLDGSGVRLTVERRHGGQWRKVRRWSQTTSASGTYRATFKPVKRGTYRVVATVAQTATHTAARTSWLGFKVT